MSDKNQTTGKTFNGYSLKESDFSLIKTRLPILLHRESEEVKAINQKAFEDYALHWAMRYRFFPVLRYIADDTLYFKLYHYHHYANLANDFMRIMSIPNTYYHEMAGITNYKSVNIITIPFREIFPGSLLAICRDMPELEKLHLASVGSNGKVSCNEDGRGSITEKGKWPIGQFDIFKRMIEEKYIQNQPAGPTPDSLPENTFLSIDSANLLCEQAYLKILGGK